MTLKAPMVASGSTCANTRAALDNAQRADARSRVDMRAGIDHGAGVNTRARLAWVLPLPQLRESRVVEVGLVDHNAGAARPRRLLGVPTDNHATGL